MATTCNLMPQRASFFNYAYAYQPKFEFSTNKFEVDFEVFFIEVYFLAFDFRSLKTRV